MNQWPKRPAGKRLFIGGERNVLRMLRIRAAMVTALFMLALGVFC